VPDLPSKRTDAPERCVIGNGVVLDSRRSAYLVPARTLIVADLHLGYSWVQRERGALFPVKEPGDPKDRLLQIQQDYSPERIVVLGDIVHKATPLPALEKELREFCGRLSESSKILFCLGNHDRHLDTLVDQWKLPVTLADEWSDGYWRLVHGDDNASRIADFILTSSSLPTIIGHEHPSVLLGDGIASQAKLPAFLVGDSVIVLPAFSNWSAGSTVGRRPFLGQIARQAAFRDAYVCLGQRLLRIPANRIPGLRAVD